MLKESGSKGKTGSHWLELEQVPAGVEFHNGDGLAFFAPNRTLTGLRVNRAEKIGDYYYNFWKDKQHERGIWRRTTLVEYRKAEPLWETVLDLDALNKAEGENWVWHGANCLRPEYTRCLIALSRGGADADVTREFDLSKKEWLKDGFFRAEAKGGLGWIDQDNVFVYTDFGDGTMTTSGYPRVVKRWKRGTPMSAATPVYEGTPQEIGRAHV